MFFKFLKSLFRRQPPNPPADLNPDELRGFFLGYQTALKQPGASAMTEHYARTLKSNEFRQLLAKSLLSNAE
jgi:hypothetical protein